MTFTCQNPNAKQIAMLIVDDQRMQFAAKQPAALASTSARAWAWAMPAAGQPKPVALAGLPSQQKCPTGTLPSTQSRKQLPSMRLGP